MDNVEKSIEVDCDVRTCYNQWTQFEEFPRFMEGVKRVEQIDDKRLRWTAEIAGKEKSWEAEITYQEPDQRIAWRSTSGARNEGSVEFEPVGNEKCRVTLRMSYEPETTTEDIGSSLGIVDQRVEGDLKRFRDFVEARRTETGAWRGEIKNREVVRSGGGTPTGEARRGPVGREAPKQTEEEARRERAKRPTS